MADDLEHVARRGLVFERFLKIVGALAQLAEQPRVLDRDHRLVGEGRYQLDLLFGERPHRPAAQDDDSNRHVFPQQWHAELGVRVPERRRLGQRVFGVGGDVRDLHRPALQHDPTGQCFAARHDRMAFQIFLVFGRPAQCRSRPIDLAIAAQNERHLTFAEPRRRLGNCLQHRLQIEGLPADDLQHVAGRGLIFERLLQIARALPQFGDQPCILHRDDCLRGEILQQRNLLIGERPDLLAGRDDHPKKRVAFPQRHTQQSAVAAVFYRSTRHWMLDLGQIGNVHETRAGHQWLAGWRVGTPVAVPQPVGERLRHSAHGDRPEMLVIIKKQTPLRGAAKGVRLLEYRIEYRGEVTGRTVDDPQYLGRRGLLVERLARLRNEPRILHRDHRLGGEVLQQRDLLVGERPDFLAIDSEGAEQGVIFAQRHGQGAAGTAELDQGTSRGASERGFIRYIFKMGEGFAARDPIERRAWIRAHRRI